MVSYPSMCRYYVYDINGDGTPELLEGIGKGRADYTIHVYTAKEGSLQKLGEMFGDDIGVFGNQNILFGYYAQMGYETVTICLLLEGASPSELLQMLHLWRGLGGHVVVSIHSGL